MARTRMYWRLDLALVAAAAISIYGCSDVTEPVRTIGPGTARFGAQPAKGIWTVTTLADVATDACTTNSCALRTAVGQAQTGDRVVFKGNLSGTISLFFGQIAVIGKDISIDGGGRITIDAAAHGRGFWLVNNATLDIANVTITGGDATANQTCDEQTWWLCSGGAIFVEPGSHLSVSGSTLSNNHALWGGAIGAMGSATVAITATTISGNTTIDGGAVWSAGAAVTVLRSTFSGNQGDFVGAIGNNAGSLTLRSSTITGNVGGSSTGGLWSSVFPGNSFTTVMNTIIAGNTSTSDQSQHECKDVGSFPMQSFGHNLSTTFGGCQTAFVAAGDQIVSRAQLAANVLDPVLGDNGGPTKTHALVERGLAVDAGYCPGDRLDQRGLVRPYDDTRMPNSVDGCDIGAFEWQPLGKPSK